MKKLLIGLAIVVVLIGLPVVTVGSYVMGKYNGFVVGNQNVSTEWAQVETQYQRRFDLIPNLVQATKGVLQQERAVFSAIAHARAHYAGTSSGSRDRMKAAGEMDSAISRLLLVIENYPQLKSSDTVRDLMNELAGTENRVNVARFRYNEAAQQFNTGISVFPAKLLAGLFNFQPRAYFESEQAAKTAPKVSLDLK